jgi:hypothetical protein
MKLMVTLTMPWFREHYREHNPPRMERFFTPRMCSSFREMIEMGLPWAADNDGFGGFKPDPYLKMLKTLRDVPKGRFVTAPDKIYDAETTLVMFNEWEPIIRSYGLPVALVGQNGLEDLEVPWDRIDAFFVGGDDAWKEGASARRLIAEAKTHGKWVHVGRVNGPVRMWYAYHAGADSIDGSSFGRFPRKYMADGIRWLDELHKQPPNPKLIENHVYKPRYTSEEKRNLLGFAA